MLQPHIQLDENLNIRSAVLPGDPARLDRIAPFLTEVQELAYNREFRSLRGNYKGMPVLAISTGIGGASAGIAAEELHKIGVTAMVRIGSCGALQKEVKLGDLIIAQAAVKEDGTSQTYAEAKLPAVADFILMNACVEAAKDLGCQYHIGIAHSHDSFYIDNEAESQAYWSKLGVLGSDMETAALFTIARLRGVKAASILNNVVAFETDTAEAIGSYVDGANLTMQGEKNEIRVALEALLKVNG